MKNDLKFNGVELRFMIELISTESLLGIHLPIVS